MKTTKRMAALAVASLTVALSAVLSPNADAASETDKVLRFTAIPDQNTTELEAKFKPFAEHLTKALGVKVEYLPARDYQASVELFKNGDTYFAWFGGLTGVQARAAVPGAEAIAQGDSDPNYKSYLIAHKSTGLKLSEEFPQSIGKLKFTFGSQSSTSGRLMPEYFISEETGKTPTEFFSTPVGFSGSHDKTIELVCSGQYEVGAVNYKVYDQWVKEGRIKAQDCPIVWVTPPYADYNWTAHPMIEKDFGQGFTKKLQDALVEIEDPTLLLALPRDKLIPAKSEEFDGIAKVAKQLNMLR